MVRSRGTAALVVVLLAGILGTWGSASARQRVSRKRSVPKRTATRNVFVRPKPRVIVPVAAQEAGPVLPSPEYSPQLPSLESTPPAVTHEGHSEYDHGTHDAHGHPHNHDVAGHAPNVYELGTPAHGYSLHDHGTAHVGDVPWGPTLLGAVEQGETTQGRSFGAPYGFYYSSRYYSCGGLSPSTGDSGDCEARRSLRDILFGHSCNRCASPPAGIYYFTPYRR